MSGYVCIGSSGSPVTIAVPDPLWNCSQRLFSPQNLSTRMCVATLRCFCELFVPVRVSCYIPASFRAVVLFLFYAPFDTVCDFDMVWAFGFQNVLS